MRVSVYMIYILAFLLPIGAAILSGFILLNTFHSQQQATEDSQYNAGLGQLQVLYRVLEAPVLPLPIQQQGTVTKALSKGWGVPAPKSKADYCASGMRLAQRLTETTKVFSHLTQRPSAGTPTARHSDTIELMDPPM